MDFSTINLQLVTNLLLLLLIGIGPKIALVPFLEKTKKMTAEQQKEVGTKMVKTAIITPGTLRLWRLSHEAAPYLTGRGQCGRWYRAVALGAQDGAWPGRGRDRRRLAHRSPQIAVYPLAIPYLLNPVGIAVLFIASSQVESVLAVVVVVGLILLVGAFDFVVFRNMDKISKRLNPTSLVISEVVFGVLLTAVAVELAVNGLNALGIIETAAHH